MPEPMQSWTVCRMLSGIGVGIIIVVCGHKLENVRNSDMLFLYTWA